MACNFFSAKLLANGHESPRFSEWARTAANRQDSAAFAHHTSIPHDMVWYGMVYLFFHRQYKVISKQIASEMSPCTVNERRPPYNPKVVLPQLLYRQT